MRKFLAFKPSSNKLNKLQLVASPSTDLTCGIRRQPYESNSRCIVFLLLFGYVCVRAQTRRPKLFPAKAKEDLKFINDCCTTWNKTWITSVPALRKNQFTYKCCQEHLEVWRVKYGGMHYFYVCGHPDFNSYACEVMRHYFIVHFDSLWFGTQEVDGCMFYMKNNFKVESDSCERLLTDRNSSLTIVETRVEAVCRNIKQAAQCEAFMEDVCFNNNSYCKLFLSKMKKQNAETDVISNLASNTRKCSRGGESIATYCDVLREEVINTPNWAQERCFPGQPTVEFCKLTGKNGAGPCEMEQYVCETNKKPKKDCQAINEEQSICKNATNGRDVENMFAKYCAKKEPHGKSRCEAIAQLGFRNSAIFNPSCIRSCEKSEKSLACVICDQALKNGSLQKKWGQLNIDVKALLDIHNIAKSKYFTDNKDKGQVFNKLYISVCKDANLCKELARRIVTTVKDSNRAARAVNHFCSAAGDDCKMFVDAVIEIDGKKLSTAFDLICPSNLRKTTNICNYFFVKCNKQNACELVNRRKEMFKWQAKIEANQKPTDVDKIIAGVCLKPVQVDCEQVTLFALNVVKMNVTSLLKSTRYCTSSSGHINVYCSKLGLAFDEGLGKKTLSEDCDFLLTVNNDMCKKLRYICAIKGQKYVAAYCQQFVLAVEVSKKWQAATTNEERYKLITQSCVYKDQVGCQTALNYLKNSKFVIDIFKLSTKVKSSIGADLLKITLDKLPKEKAVEVRKICTDEKDQAACLKITENCDKSQAFCVELNEEKYVNAAFDSLDAFKKSISVYCNPSHERYKVMCKRITEQSIQRKKTQQTVDRIQAQCSSEATKKSCEEFLKPELWSASESTFTSLVADICKPKFSAHFCTLATDACVENQSNQVSTKCTDLLMNKYLTEIEKDVEQKDIKGVENSVGKVCVGDKAQPASKEWCQKTGEFITKKEAAAKDLISKSELCLKDVKKEIAFYCGGLVQGAFANVKDEKQIRACNFMLEEKTECQVLANTCGITQTPKICSLVNRVQSAHKQFSTMSSGKLDSLSDTLNEQCNKPSQLMCEVIGLHLAKYTKFYSELLPSACGKDNAMPACQILFEKIEVHKMTETVYNDACNKNSSRSVTACQIFAKKCNGKTDDFCTTVQINEFENTFQSEFLENFNEKKALAVLNETCKKELAGAFCKKVVNTMATKLDSLRLLKILDKVCVDKLLPTCNPLIQSRLDKEVPTEFVNQLCSFDKWKPKCQLFASKCKGDARPSCEVFHTLDKYFEVRTEMVKSNFSIKAVDAAAENMCRNDTFGLCKKTLAFVQNTVSDSDHLKKLLSETTKCGEENKIVDYCSFLQKKTFSDAYIEKECEFMFVLDSPICQNILNHCNGAGAAENQTFCEKVVEYRNLGIQVLETEDVASFSIASGGCLLSEEWDDKKWCPFVKTAVSYLHDAKKWTFFDEACTTQTQYDFCTPMSEYIMDMDSWMPFHDALCLGTEPYYSSSECKGLLKHCAGTSARDCDLIRMRSSTVTAKRLLNAQHFNLTEAVFHVGEVCSGHYPDECNELEELIGKLRVNVVGQFVVKLCDKSSFACSRTFTELTKRNIFEVYQSVCKPPPDMHNCQIFYTNCHTQACAHVKADRPFIENYKNITDAEQETPAGFEKRMEQLCISGEDLCTQLSSLLSDLTATKKTEKFLDLLSEGSAACSDSSAIKEMKPYCDALYEHLDKMYATVLEKELGGQADWNFGVLDKHCDLMLKQDADNKCKMLTARCDTSDAASWYCSYVKIAATVSKEVLTNPDDLIQYAAKYCPEEASHDAESILECQIVLRKVRSTENKDPNFIKDICERNIASVCSRELKTLIEESGSVKSAFDGMCGNDEDGPAQWCNAFVKYHCDSEKTPSDDCGYIKALLQSVEDGIMTNPEDALQLILKHCDGKSVGRVCERWQKVAAEHEEFDERLTKNWCLSSEVPGKKCRGYMTKISEQDRFLSLYQNMCSDVNDTAIKEKQCKFFYAICAEKAVDECLHVLDDQEFHGKAATLRSGSEHAVYRVLATACENNMEMRNCKRMMQRISELGRSVPIIAGPCSKNMTQSKYTLCRVLTQRALEENPNAAGKIYDNICAKVSDAKFTQTESCTTANGFCSQSKAAGCVKYHKRECTSSMDFNVCHSHANSYCLKKEHGETGMNSTACDQFFGIFEKSKFLTSKIKHECVETSSELCLTFIEIDLLSASGKISGALFPKNCADTKSKKMCSTIVNICSKNVDLDSCVVTTKVRCSVGTTADCVNALGLLCVDEAKATRSEACAGAAFDGMKNEEASTQLLKNVCEESSPACKAALLAALQRGHLTKVFDSICVDVNSFEGGSCKLIIEFCAEDKNSQCTIINSNYEVVMATTGEVCTQYEGLCKKLISKFCTSDAHAENCKRMLERMPETTYLTALKKCDESEIEASACIVIKDTLAETRIWSVFQLVCPVFSDHLGSRCQKYRGFCDKSDSVGCEMINEIYSSLRNWMIVGIITGSLCILSSLVMFGYIIRMQQRVLEVKAAKIAKGPEMDSMMAPI